GIGATGGAGGRHARGAALLRRGGGEGPGAQQGETEGGKFQSLCSDTSCFHGISLAIGLETMKGGAGDKPPTGPAKGFIAQTRLEERSEEHTSELQSRENLVCRLLLE